MLVLELFISVCMALCIALSILKCSILIILIGASREVLPNKIDEDIMFMRRHVYEVIRVVVSNSALF